MLRAMPRKARVDYGKLLREIQTKLRVNQSQLGRR